MRQTPQPGERILKWCGDTLEVVLETGSSAKGRAVLRTNIGNAGTVRRETIASAERGETPMERGWADVPLEETAPGVYRAAVPLREPGVFLGKTCFFPDGSREAEWPEGGNFRVKVEPASTRSRNSIYTVFPRQFGSFREVARRLPEIMDGMGFGIVQTLPPFPVPTTYAVMGEYGCPFASLDFMSVDPAMAEFDGATTPLDQFTELMDAVHARGGRFFIDLPANHTGWGSTLQTHHPEWFRRGADGRFVSPGAWGVVWADLVELDYSCAALRSYMADVFLFWCRRGVDGFRCDAGYMIPREAWDCIVAKVREEFPDTVFMLEGLGGDLRVTDALLSESGLDWAYSEIFQTYDRAAFERYLPRAAERSETLGTLVHFAETHDNDRLAAGGETYAALRVQIAALLSWQGAWGIANGVEWFCREKIDVHGRNGLSWGAERNMTGLVARLNGILSTHPSFSGPCHVALATRGGGNVLAVARSRPGSPLAELLVLANLDCENPCAVDWDRSVFPHGVAFDLMTERRVECSAPVVLGPGQVMCLSGGAPDRAFAPEREADESPALFRWRFPLDVRREVVVPAGETLRISAPSRFRAVLADPADGRVLAAPCAAPAPDGGFAAHLAAPPYEGDGTRCRRLELRMTVYGGEKAERTASAVLVPPPPEAARVKTSVSGAEIRRDPAMRAILANETGAASQMRAGWASIASQYDAILSANPRSDCPSDRLNLWTRTRCWVQCEGYSRELDGRCVKSLSVDPAGSFARWEFSVPCGTGRSAAFEFTVSLASESNAARLAVRRLHAGEADAPGAVRLVFRPDVEWRSFHAATKAFAGPETLFPRSVEARPGGFSFHPAEGEFRLTVEGGEFHLEPEWTYNVPHPEEAARGQEPAGDLFSPGWISADLAAGESASLTGEYVEPGAKGVRHSFPECRPLPAAIPLVEAAERAMELFIVRRDRFKTVIAGYPWFLDWGRDTFIFMRGMIAAGMVEDSVSILRAFAAFEESGTLPNIIYGDTAGNRDTTDAQLWFVRCVREIKERTSHPGLRALEKTCRSIVESYISGTPNGIRMDAETALVFSPSHFTWMDTNYPACTPRAGYPVEIQALWISALEFAGRRELAEKARASVVRLFAKADGGFCDCLDAPDGSGAERASCDCAVRPNQLLLATLGVVRDASAVFAAEELLVPGSIRSLSASHPLYRGRYEGDEDTMRKPAYHNGTAWGWQFPMFAEAAASLGVLSRRSALSLLASAVDNFNAGCIGHMSEIADGDAPHAQKGCAAQAWSASEALRVWKVLSEGNGNPQEGK